MLNKSFVLFFCLMIDICSAKCVGRFLNPVTDVCWSCIFPIRIAGVQVVSGGPDPQSPRQPLCVCAPPDVTVPRVGIPVSFWEPVRLVDNLQQVLTQQGDH